MAAAAEAATTFVASDDELAGQASVDFDVESSAELGSADLRAQDLSRSAGGGGGGTSASSDRDPGPALSAEEEASSSPSQLELPLLPDVEAIGGVDPRAPVFPPAAAGRHVVVAVRVDFQLGHAGGGGAAMRLAALLVMFVAAMSLTGEPDAPRANQFRALMVWLGGCILLFLLRH